MSDTDYSSSASVVAAMSVRDVAAFLNSGKSTVWKLIKELRLPAKRLGARTLILRSDAEKFLQELPPARSAAA